MSRPTRTRGRKQATQLADRMWRRAEIVRQADGLRWGWDNDVLAYLLKHEFRAPWVGFGTNRIALPVGPKLVIKMGTPATMKDEQDRWEAARRHPGSRKWMLPILASRPGSWSLMPLAAPLADRFRDDFESLEYAAILDAYALRGIEDDLGAENWGMYKGRPVVLDYGGTRDRSMAHLRSIGLANDGFAGWSVRAATARDPRGGRHGSGAWVAEKDGRFVHRFDSPSSAWRFVRESLHPGGDRPWKGSANEQRPAPCELVSIADGAEHDYLAGYGYDIANDVGINIASHEEPLFACIAGDEGDPEVLGAAFAGSYDPWDDPDMAGEFRFTVVVDPDAQRRGIGRMLVRALKDHYLVERDDIIEAYGMPWLELVAWVVNPNMADLLESEGFDSDGSEWSQNSPMMRWSG